MAALGEGKQLSGRLWVSTAKGRVQALARSRTLPSLEHLCMFCAMTAIGSRRAVAKRVVLAHIFGLCVTGIVGTIGTSEGLSFDGVVSVLYLGGLLSLPWVAVLGLLIWFRGQQIDRHPIAFAIIGPVVVGASWGIVTGAFFEEAVVISSVASSVFYLATIAAKPGFSKLWLHRTNVR